MLKILNKFEIENKILINNEKNSMHTILSAINGRRTSYIQWVIHTVDRYSYKHKICMLLLTIQLNTDDIECNVKISQFNGYVNKLKANFGNLQSNILMNLFKSYCWSFYGSHSWINCTNAFDKYCKSCNIVIPNLLHLQYNAHTCLLGP